MPVVATTGAWECSSRTRCWHARCCDDRCVGVQFSNEVLACPLLLRHRCMRVQFSNKVLACLLLRRQVRGSAVLEQGIGMHVVATTGAWGCISPTRCWHARCCDDRCVGVQFSNKVLACPLLRRHVHEGAVLEQGVGMPVVATTGAWGCSSRTRCWHARCCDDRCVAVQFSNKVLA